MPLRPPCAGLERADVVLGVLDRLARELVGALRVLQGLLRVRRLQLLSLHERRTGLRQAGACLRADRAAPGDDEVLGRRNLGLGLQDLLADHLLRALRLRSGIPDALR